MARIYKLLKPRIKTDRLVSLYRKHGSVRKVALLTPSLSYMGVRFRLIHAGVISGKLEY